MIPIIDLFAGPGGLGEGFSSLVDQRGHRIFKIALSIEMNPAARSTLRLRSFYRQFSKADVPDAYFEMMQGNISVEELFRRFPKQAAASDHEAWRAELGKVGVAEVDGRIRNALDGAQNWVLIGGPPCQAYSLVGRSRVINVNREKYEKDRRHFLYQEYLRILQVHRPPVFIMENVKGILSSKMKGSLIVEQILSDLETPLAEDKSQKASSATLRYRLYPLADYRESDTITVNEHSPSDFIIRSERHGIPQARHRFIVLGVRTDVDWTPGKLHNSVKPVTVGQAIGDLPCLRSRLSHKGTAKGADNVEEWVHAVQQIRQISLSRKNGFPPELRDEILLASRRLFKGTHGGAFVQPYKKPRWRNDWFGNYRLRGVSNHESRRHRKDDLWRYLFAAAFASVYSKSPTLVDFPIDLLPDHKNIQALKDDSAQIVFADRFRVQVKDRCSTTVTSHIAKDGHYFIHYDPTQCRSLTVREAARLQTFPDDYLFLGGKTEQYTQVGNAVPPLLANQLAEIVSECFLKR